MPHAGEHGAHHLEHLDIVIHYEKNRHRAHFLREMRRRFFFAVELTRSRASLKSFCAQSGQSNFGFLAMAPAAPPNSAIGGNRVNCVGADGLPAAATPRPG
jgi:hypothetical protein